jgi:hypothetical protein
MKVDSKILADSSYRQLAVVLEGILGLIGTIQMPHCIFFKKAL